MDKPFGSNLHVRGFTVKGRVDKDVAALVLAQITEKIGMSPVYWPVVYQYPAVGPTGGKGGFGFTRIQPITESFLAFDAWPDLGGAYLIICSCKDFDTEAVAGVLHANGLEVIENKNSLLEIPQ